MLITELRNGVAALNLQPGINYRLDAQLKAALIHVNNNKAGAIISLGVFINLVQLRCRTIICNMPLVDADALIDKAQEIIILLRSAP